MSIRGVEVIDIIKFSKIFSDAEGMPLLSENWRSERLHNVSENGLTIEDGLCDSVYGQIAKSGVE